MAVPMCQAVRGLTRLFALVEGAVAVVDSAPSLRALIVFTHKMLVEIAH